MPRWRLTVPLALLLSGCQDDAAPPTARVAAGAIAAPAPAVDVGAAPLSIDDRGLPRLLRNVRVPAAPASTPEESARILVERLAPAWRVRDLPVLEAAGTVPFAGGAVVRLRQTLDGLPVDGGELRLLIGPGGELRAASGVLVDAAAPRGPARFDLDADGAIAAAVRHAYGVASGDVVVEQSRARAVWRRDGDQLVTAWIVELYASHDGDDGAWRTAIAGDDGRVLAHEDLTVDAEFSYRVYAETTGELRPLDGPTEDFSPHPTGTPDGTLPGFVAPSLVTVDSLNDQGDPWLADGATVTTGNNADVYTDPDGDNQPDLHATVTAPGVFDRTYDLSAGPIASDAQQQAALTHLFFAINWLHDYWYDAGFTEAAGNGQLSNYGRGGAEGDPLLIEAHDGLEEGSRNNANMSTPADGMSPRMQVYVWDGEEDRSLVIDPAGREPLSESASFGPRDFDIGGPVLLADDGTGANPNDGCEALSGVGGTIVLLDRGNCSFETKALNVQNAGGIGMLVADNVENEFPPFLGDDDTITTPITIPCLSVTQAEGATIKGELDAGGVDATMHREVGPDLEGSLDATLVAHEFGHYFHHRLSDCSGNLMCGAMSEGWGDFLALHLLLRDGDDLDGAYVVAGYATRGFGGDPGYFGIRRVPYSVDRAKNDLSFRHMAAGEELPTEHPLDDNGGCNCEVHNAGEVWATTLFEAYVALIRASASFEEGRAKMARYLVAGLLLAPTQASPLEMRDAILAAAEAESAADRDVLLDAFRSRGMGSCAVSPPADSSDFVGIVESYAIGGFPLLGTPVIDDGVVSCDGDGILDGEETAQITVPLVNAGHQLLRDVAVTLRSTTAGITIAEPTLELGTVLVGGEATLTFEVSLGATDQALIGNFELEVTSTDGCEDSVTVPFTAALNVSDRPGSSSTDQFDTQSSVWETEAPAVWEHAVPGETDRYWLGRDLGGVNDASLVSPPLRASGELTITFSHRYQFEADEEQFWDGGVIEISTDDGTTWTDVRELGADPGYDGTLTDISGNPLGGRMAYSGQNPSYPEADVVMLSLGGDLDGQQFRLRFRIGTDQAVGAGGWEIDDVAVTGIDGTPFPTRVTDDGCDGGDGGGCCSAGDLGASQVGGGIGLLAFLVGRRRRRRGGGGR